MQTNETEPAEDGTDRNDDGSTESGSDDGSPENGSPENGSPENGSPENGSPEPGSLENYGEADDGQDYVDRSKIDFDPADGLLSGTAIDGTSDIPDPDEVTPDAG